MGSSQHPVFVNNSASTPQSAIDNNGRHVGIVEGVCGVPAPDTQAGLLVQVERVVVAYAQVLVVTSTPVWLVFSHIYVEALKIL